MPKRTVRRSVAVALLAASLLAVTSCDVVRQGVRCRNGAAPGRDATHVLFCQAGRWKRVMTIGQAADFIMSSWPTQVELLEGGGQTTGIGEAFGQVSVRVTRKDGAIVQGADVLFSGPASGASLAASSGLVATDAAGIARFVPVANGELGGYPVTATVSGGYTPSVTFGLNNAAGGAATVAVVSGSGQTATAGTQFAQPVVVRAVDRFGNTVTNKRIVFSTPTAGVWFGPAEAFAGDDGLATTTVGTGNVSGTLTITAGVVGTDAATTFNLSVVAGEIANNDGVSGSGQEANAANGNRFNNPLNVALSDQFGNPIKGYPVTYAVQPNNGAGGTLDAETVNTSDDGISRGWVTGNGVAGSFTVIATVGAKTHSFTLTNP